MLQRLAPVASRAENIFSETCQTFLRFTVPPNLKESIKSVADVNDLSSILKVSFRLFSNVPLVHDIHASLILCALQSLALSFVRLTM